MRIENNSKLAGLCPQMVLAFIIAGDILKRYGQEPIITCGSNGTHTSRNSKHYIGHALDLRTWDLNDPAAVAEIIQSALGDEFYVKAESTHMHIQYNGSVM